MTFSQLDSQCGLLIAVCYIHVQTIGPRILWYIWRGHTNPVSQNNPIQDEAGGIYQTSGLGSILAFTAKYRQQEWVIIAREVSWANGIDAFGERFLGCFCKSSTGTKNVDVLPCHGLRRLNRRTGVAIEQPLEHSVPAMSPDPGASTPCRISCDFHDSLPPPPWIKQLGGMCSTWESCTTTM